MNTNPLPEPADEDVKKTAYLLYLASGCVSGRDMENWLAARAQEASNYRQTGENTPGLSSGLVHFPLNANVSRSPFEPSPHLENRN